MLGQHDLQTLKVSCDFETLVDFVIETSRNNLVVKFKIHI